GVGFRSRGDLRSDEGKKSPVIPLCQRGKFLASNSARVLNFCGSVELPLFEKEGRGEILRMYYLIFNSACAFLAKLQSKISAMVLSSLTGASPRRRRP